MNEQHDLEQKILSNLLYKLDLVEILEVDSDWFTVNDYGELVHVLVLNKNNGIPDLHTLLMMYKETYPARRMELEILFKIHDACYPVDLENTTKAMLKTLQERYLMSVVVESSVIAQKYPSKESVELLRSAVTDYDEFHLPTNDGGILTTVERMHDKLLNGVAPGIKTYSCVDYLLGEIRPGQLIGIAGAPGTGKSSFLLNIAYKALTRAEQSDVKVDIFTLEMAQEEVLNRLVSIHTGIKGRSLRNPKMMLTPKEKEQYTNALKFFGNKKLDIYDNLFSFEAIAAIIKRNAKKYNGKYLPLIDYLQLMEINGFKEEYAKISELTRQLKKLTGAYRTPIICLSQLSRARESEKDKKPHLHHLRGSGSIEQDFSTVGILYDPKDEDQPDKIVWNVEKNREGSVKELEFYFRKEIMLFEEVSYV